MFGSKMEGKKESDLGISSSQNCAAEDLSRQDSLEGKMEEERKRCSRMHVQGMSGETKKDAKPTSSTAALLKEVKEAAACKKKPRIVNELQRRNTSRNKGAWNDNLLMPRPKIPEKCVFRKELCDHKFKSIGFTHTFCPIYNQLCLIKYYVKVKVLIWNFVRSSQLWQNRRSAT